MDRTEISFKIAIELIEILSVLYVLLFFLPLLYATILSIILVHTVNWILNCQFYALLKKFRLVQTKKEVFNRYLTHLLTRAQQKGCISSIRAFGSFARAEMTEFSDIDIRILRKKGFRNGIRSCAFAVYERVSAFLSKVPLDLYVFDKDKSFSKMKETSAVILFSDQEDAKDFLSLKMKEESD